MKGFPIVLAIIGLVFLAGGIGAAANDKVFAACIILLTGLGSALVAAWLFGDHLRGGQ